MKYLQLSFSVFALILIACTSPKVEVIVEPSISSEKTQEVLNHHLDAIGQNDLEAIVSDYSDNSIIVTPDSTYRGLVQIEGFFEGILPAFPTDGTLLELDITVIDNELAYILWHATTPSLDVPFGTDTFIIEDGKIRLQTFAAVLNPKE